MSLQNRIRNLLNSFIRYSNGLKRPSRKRNLELMQDSGQSLNSFSIREADMNDVPKLAELHVKTWNDTYGGTGPSVELRTQQWRQQFNDPNHDWFVLVIEKRDGELIGFAKAQPYNSSDLPGYSGELNKIYLLRDYQRLGLGRRLFDDVVKRLLDRGITSMVLFGIPQNPSCKFHEAMGGERLCKPGEVFQGGYGWRDLQKVVE